MLPDLTNATRPPTPSVPHDQSEVPATMASVNRARSTSPRWTRPRPWPISTRPFAQNTTMSHSRLAHHAALAFVKSIANYQRSIWHTSVASNYMSTARGDAPNLPHPSPLSSSLTAKQLLPGGLCHKFTYLQFRWETPAATPNPATACLWGHVP